MILQLTNLRQLCFYNCHICANYVFTIIILAPIMILQFLQLHQLYFYNCHTCAHNNFTIINYISYVFTIVTPIIQLSYTCANYIFTIFITCASYVFTIVKLHAPTILQFIYSQIMFLLAPIMILQLSNLRQLYFYNCYNYYTCAQLCHFTIAPIIILQLCTCANYVILTPIFKNVRLASIMILQFLHLR